SACRWCPARSGGTTSPTCFASGRSATRTENSSPQRHEGQHKDTQRETELNSISLCVSLWGLGAFVVNCSLSPADGGEVHLDPLAGAEGPLLGERLGLAVADDLGLQQISELAAGGQGRRAELPHRRRRRAFPVVHVEGRARRQLHRDRRPLQR